MRKPFVLLNLSRLLTAFHGDFLLAVPGSGSCEETEGHTDQRSKQVSECGARFELVSMA